MKPCICILLALLAITAFSCSPEKEKTVNITFWAFGAEGESVLKLIPEFRKRNPGINVTVQAIPWTAAQEKLITAFASNNLPDACQLGNTWVPQFASLKALEELNPLIGSSAVIKENKYFPGIWDTNVLDGRVYGIPWYIDTRLLFYRTDILARAGYNHPPATWAELYDVSRKIKQNATGEQYAIYLPTNEWATFIIFGLQNGSGILKDNGRYGDFSSRSFREAFEYLIRFHREGLAPVGISQVTNIYQAFAEGFLAMYISGPWNIKEFKKWMTGDLRDKWMTAPMPVKDDGSVNPAGGGTAARHGVSLAGGSSLVMFRTSRHKDAVWKFFEYLSETDTQIRFYKELDDLPAIKSAWGDSLLVNNKYMKPFFEQFQNVVATPKVPEWEQIAFSKVQQYAELAARGEMTPDQALKALDREVNQILEKRRWLLEGNKL